MTALRLALALASTVGRCRADTYGLGTTEA